MPKPDFFIVGAAKCGTSSLYTYLRQHPDIFMPHMKEPNFFGSDVTGGGAIVRAVAHSDEAADTIRLLSRADNTIHTLRGADNLDSAAKLLDRSYDLGQMADEEVEFLLRLSQDNDCAFIITGSRAETTVGSMNRTAAQELTELGYSLEDVFARTGVPEWRAGASTGKLELDYFTPPGQGGMPAQARRALHRYYDTASNVIELDNWARYRRAYGDLPPGGIVFDHGTAYRNYLETWQYWSVTSP